MEILNVRPLKSKKRHNFFTPSEDEKKQAKEAKAKEKLKRKEKNLMRIKKLQDQIEKEKHKLLMKCLAQQISEEEEKSHDDSENLNHQPLNQT